MYTNIPTEELLNIIDIICDKHNIEDTLKLEIAKYLQTDNSTKLLHIPRQNLFTKEWSRRGGPNIIPYVRNLFVIH